MNINDIVLQLNNFIWGWPLIIFVVGAAIIITLNLKLVQFRYFLRAWKLLLSPEHGAGQADMSPFQAFLNALSASVGNGSIAGMATAIYSGGPGAALWVFVIGILGMSIRYCEVYLSTIFGVRQLPTGPIGGPMIYLGKVPGGSFLPYVYAFFCLMLGFASGNAMQANSIRIGIVRILPVAPIVVAIVLLLFMLYVMLGGAQRIIKVSDRIVPIKVGVFFLTAIIVLLYHWQAIIPAIKLMIAGAFTPQAIMGGAIGYSTQSAIRFGMARVLNSSEIGLGTAAVLFGGSASTNPVHDGFMGMLTAFISANCVSFLLCLMLIASGVWANGQTSIDLVITAYETVFGSAGGWIVTFLSMSFGLGVIVTYAYISRACWLFLTKGRFVMLYGVLFSLATFAGAIAKVDLIWNSIDLVNAGLVVSNIFGILCLLPVLREGLKKYQHAK